MTILKKIESIHAIKQGFIDNDDESKKNGEIFSELKAMLIDKMNGKQIDNNIFNKVLDDWMNAEPCVNEKLIKDVNDKKKSN